MPSVTYVVFDSDPITIDVPETATAAEQTALIQSALDAVADAGGGLVTLSEGSFEVTGTGKAADGALRIGSNTTLEGAGMGLTTIKLADGSTSVTGILRTDSGQTLADGTYKTTHNVTIRDLSIDGNQANTTGDVDGFYSGSRPDSGLRDTNITLDRVEVHNASRYGFDPHEGTTNLSITNSIAHHNGRDGFTIDGSEHVVLSNNVAYENGRHGINIVTGSRDVLVENNRSTDNGSSGLVIQTGDNEIRAWTSDITVTGGSFDNNARYGIEVKHAQDISIADASVTGNGYHGIILAGVVGADIAGVAMSDNNNGGSQLRLKNYVQDFDDNEVLNDRVIVTSDVVVDGEPQPEPTDNLDVPLYDWVITPGDDVIFGTEIADRISSGDGADQIFGEGGNDILAGNAGDDVLDGGAGDDLVMGNIGDDVLLASTGYDRLDGGAGFDTVDFSNMDAAVYMDLKFSGAQVLTSGKQSVSKKSATTEVAELSGVEAFIGTGFADKLFGSNDADWLSGGDGNDLLKGRAGQDTIFGDDGADRLRGNGGSDHLDGGRGNDDLRGGGGNDVLIGGEGDDILFGGSGSDQFTFGQNWGVDTIRDFRPGKDKISFDATAGVTSIDDLVIADHGNGSRVSFEGQEILIEGVAASTLSECDFLLH